MHAVYIGELSHAGIKGMKWGERRYRNEDGTLTEEGKKRYAYYKDNNVKKYIRKKNENDEDYNARMKRNEYQYVREQANNDNQLVSQGAGQVQQVTRSSSNIVDDIAMLRKLSKKSTDLSNKTDQELREEVNRMNLERQYRDLTEKAPKGEAYAKAILNTVGDLVGVAGGIAGIVVLINQIKQGRIG